MKRFALLWASLVFCLSSGAAERVFVSTDRNVYVCGDHVYCSLFCFDTESKKLSALSSVAYLELISSEGTAATAKIGLLGGRGAGMIELPGNLKTGNYLLAAYTKAGGEDRCFDGAQLLSVFNTSAVSRVTGNVSIVKESEYIKSSPEEIARGLSINIHGRPVSGKSFTMNIVNNTGLHADFSISVHRVDDISIPWRNHVKAFLDSLSRQSTPPSGALPEYEGEIIKARTAGHRPASVILSSAGAPSDIYFGRPSENGEILFFTNNIFGDRELVINTGDSESSLVIESPFLNPSAKDIPSLQITSALSSSLISRKASIPADIPSDTLFSFLPRRQDILLEGVQKKTYHLDDYTRFPSIKETLTEITPDLTVRKSHGKNILRLNVKNPSSGRINTTENVLIMTDGVVMDSIDSIIDIDANIFSDIDIYPARLAFGGKAIDGIVNFVTAQNYIKAISMPDYVRVIDFQGTCYPVAYLGGYPYSGNDLRQLLYWHPCLDINKGEAKQLVLKAPSNPGSYVAMAEGLSEEGEPLVCIKYFECY